MMSCPPPDRKQPSHFATPPQEPPSADHTHVWTRLGRPGPWQLAYGMLALALLTGAPRSHAQAGKPAPKVVATQTAWKPLFDGKSLQGWKITNFGGEGEVLVEDGVIDMGMGSSLTGITYAGRIPKCNYEVRVEAMRIDGIDFFSTITFPVKDSFCSLVVGGWAGAVVGISCINRADASENETTSYMKFDAKKWYHIRLQVGEDRLRAWIDDKQVVDLDLKDRQLSTRRKFPSPNRLE